MRSRAFTLERLVGSSAVMARALRGAERAAQSDSAILIVGEPGSGRTSLARSLHEANDTRTGRLVEVDVGTIPSTLFESELFGYRAGAFSGASRDYTGRVGRANGGTLLLDHVEELPLQTQPKLLRLLAEGIYTPLGGRDMRADTRVIAIASNELPERIRRQLFREDLFYRLDVLSFVLPPLRRRLEDLEALVGGMLEDLRQRYQRPELELDPEALEWMRRYSWPGNLRQLRNLLERQLVLSPTERLNPEAPQDTTGQRPRRLRDAELEELRKALAYTRGHQGRAAVLLGISRKSLWEKRRRFGIE
ncbi:MAG TPA: sigma 54-interacting transcriptional regulator [Thermoanaerobaculia bacterium]|nr:sigma 54-interacting transcriptional regulator [Thermoanaerobaculia bacterium]